MMRNSTFLLLGLGLSFTFCIAPDAMSQSRPSSSRGVAIQNAKAQYAPSEKRKLMVKRVVDKMHESGKDCKRRTTRLDIIEKLETELDCPLLPNSPADVRTEPQIEKQALSDISRKFPLSVSNYFKKMNLEAIDKYGLIKQGEYVTIDVNTSRGKVSKGGNYNGMFDNERKIRIDDEIFLTKDLDQTFLDRLDPKKVKDKIAEYAQRKRNEYETKKRRAYEGAIVTIKEQQVINNQLAGYIFNDNKWITAEAYMDLLIEGLPDLKAIEEARLAAERDAKIAIETATALKKLEEKKAKEQQEKEAKEKAANPQPQADSVVKVDEGIYSKLTTEFNAQNEKWAKKIEGQKKSADMIAGVDSIPWLATSEEVAFFLSNAKDLVASDTMVTYTNDSDIITGLPCHIVIPFNQMRMIQFKRIYAPASPAEETLIREKIIEAFGKPTVGTENWMGADFKVKIKLDPKYSSKGEIELLEYNIEYYDGESELRKLPPVKKK